MEKEEKEEEEEEKEKEEEEEKKKEKEKEKEKEEEEEEKEMKKEKEKEKEKEEEEEQEEERRRRRRRRRRRGEAPLLPGWLIRALDMSISISRRKNPKGTAREAGVSLLHLAAHLERAFTDFAAILASRQKWLKIREFVWNKITLITLWF